MNSGITFCLFAYYLTNTHTSNLVINAPGSIFIGVTQAILHSHFYCTTYLTDHGTNSRILLLSLYQLCQTCCSFRGRMYV